MATRLTRRKKRRVAVKHRPVSRQGHAADKLCPEAYTERVATSEKRRSFMTTREKGAAKL